MTNHDALNELRGVAVALQMLQEQNAGTSPALWRALTRLQAKLDHAVSVIEANELESFSKRMS